MKFTIITILLISQITLIAQDSTQTLDQVIVTANFQETEIKKVARNISIITAKDIELAPVKTLDGILQYALNVDVRSRGPLGVQADISIRGGHYDQTLIMLDGVKLNDPQTGHHSLNLPVSMEMVERIEVLQGGASRVYGPSAFAGVINIITKKNQPNQLNLGYSHGQFGLNKLNIGGAKKFNKINISGGYEFIVSNGFAKNTAFDRTNIFLKSGFIVSKSTEINLSTGLFSNKFGAANYYSPTFYDQYEETSSAVFIGQIKQNIGNNFSTILTASWRNHDDMYDFNKYRKTADKFNSINFHQTEVKDLSWINKLISNLGTTSIGLEWRSEGVISNRLGDILANPIEIQSDLELGYQKINYTKGKIRKNSSAYFEQYKQFEKATLTFGTLLNFNSQFGNNWYPGADFSYAITERKNIYSNINRSLRFPTFTEMYLTGATVKGDPNLQPEDAWTYEIGMKHKAKAVQWTTAVFYKHSNSAIDKVKRPEFPVPTMETIGDMNTRGFEFSTVLNVSDFKGNTNCFLQRIQFNYAYINADKKEAGYQSFYTLNYLKNKASVGFNWRFAQNIIFDTWYTNKQREGSYQLNANTLPVNYAPINLIDVRLNFTQKYFRLFVDGTNLLNRSYYEFGFVEQPKRWLSAGVSVNLK